MPAPRNLLLTGFSVLKKFLPLAVACISALLTASACSRTPYWQYDYYGVMNSDARLKIFCPEGEEYEARFKQLAADIKQELRNAENSLSADKEGSAVNRFNLAAAGEKVELDGIAYSVLKTATEMYRLTDGAYNPAVYYSLKAYGFNGGEPPASPEELPSDGEIAVYRELSEHFAEVRLCEENGKYYAVKPDFSAEWEGETLALKIDLGGIGKGYAADAACELIGDRGFGYGYFDFGSSSIAFKEYPDKSGKFDLHLTNPRGGDGLPQSYITLGVGDVRLSTSADKNNCFWLDADGDGEEERFCHIINPATGRPSRTGIISVTVIGGTAAENDALTTAIMAMGSGKAINFIEQKLQNRVVFFAVEGERGLGYYTNAASGSYTVDDERYSPLFSYFGGGGNVS